MNYEKIKSIALALLVLISLAFTWGIWNYQPSYETIREDSSEIVKEVEIGQQQKISVLLKPSKIIVHLQDNHYGTVAKEELTWVMEEMASWTFYEPENISSSLSERQFDELLSGNSRVELFFTSDIPFNTIKNVFVFNDSVVPNAVFDRIVISGAEGQGNHASVYFVSVEERLVFKSEIESPSLLAFKTRFLKKSDRLEPYISHEIPNGSRLFVREEPPVLPVQKYLPAPIDTDKFKKALFTDPSYVRRGSRSGQDEYTDGSSIMSVNQSTRVIEYVDLAQESETGQEITLDQLIDKSISFVNDHNGWVDDYRLFSAEAGSSEISYRLFSGDFPVFNSLGMAEIKQNWGRDSIFEYERPSFTIHNPLPETGSPVKLDKGEDALKKVLAKDIDPTLLTDMRIGYEMTDQPEILALEPSWYYRYNGMWLRLEPDEGGAADGLE
ncbi:YycH family regulatory protein [Domibacillus epiphyticus]|uniref:Regulatory protein YycH domain-containing protein n=1 Tax=Domibacillus epiphyticus TaxID=1714355 RepID=A0A1V2A660_9BACI|nr:two-component system activity regulator YycH [Domibacillus epiphyticus]OMP66417.1 hypothetical protein BTO28_11965 [Domibacillus epiphyticus]